VPKLPFHQLQGVVGWKTEQGILKSFNVGFMLQPKAVKIFLHLYLLGFKEIYTLLSKTQLFHFCEARRNTLYQGWL